MRKNQGMLLLGVWERRVVNKNLKNGQEQQGMSTLGNKNNNNKLFRFFFFFFLPRVNDLKQRHKGQKLAVENFLTVKVVEH